MIHIQFLCGCFGITGRAVSISRIEASRSASQSARSDLGRGKMKKADYDL